MTIAASRYCAGLKPTQARGVVQETQTPVAIVGGGPVGLVLALFLDFHGAKCTIFNTEPTRRWHPKGNGQNARTMELYRRLGFSDEVRRLGLPGDHPFDQAYFTRLSSHEIYRFPMPTRDERIAMRRQMPVTDQLPEPMFHVNQMYVERYLLERVRKLAERRRPLRLGGRLVHAGRERGAPARAPAATGPMKSSAPRPMRPRATAARLHQKDAGHRL